MSGKNIKISTIIKAGSIAVTAIAAIIYAKRRKEMAESSQNTIGAISHKDTDRNAYFAGGGLASMAGAAYLIRDCGFDGRRIHIYEDMRLSGSGNDGTGEPEAGFICPGGGMLNEETCENFWELLRSIPSLELPGKSVTEEILSFDRLHPTHAQARLINKEGRILDVTSMGFQSADRLALGKLMFTPEDSLDEMTIEEWFATTPHFFTTGFWYMWQTTFAIQKWSSLLEFKRCIKRMILEFSRIETLEGVTSTRYNQNESVLLPLKTFLKEKGVQFHTNAAVTDIDFEDDDDMCASAIHLDTANGAVTVEISKDDLCIVTNGCTSDNAALGDMHTPAAYKPETPPSGELWAKLAKKRPELGDPSPFFDHPKETNWESFTVTCKGNRLLKKIERYSGNNPGSGALMTFKDSGWLLSIAVAAQPHFKNQPMDTTVFWGYGLYTDTEGDYIKKTMRDCTGEELVIELLHHLHWEDEIDTLMKDVVNVIPCMLPYIGAHFQPRRMADRPPVVPNTSKNFALISRFVEIPEDTVFTGEYSVRAARIAVYTLMNVTGKRLCPVTQYQKVPRVLLKTLQTAFQ